MNKKYSQLEKGARKTMARTHPTRDCFIEWINMEIQLTMQPINSINIIGITMEDI